MSESVPLASVIVVCWNCSDVLGRCLEHLLSQDYPNYEIVVVDDGSQDNTVEVAEELLGSGKLSVVRSSLNRGCPHARNLGLLHARGDVIAFIDADGYAAPSWLRHVVAEFQRDSTVGGVASTVFMEANPLVVNGGGGIVNRQGWAADLSMSLPYDRAAIPAEALYPMGCGMAVSRAAVESVGAFDDRMLNYYDDVDYGIRIWRSGYRVVVAPDAWIDHGFGHSGGDSPHKQLLCEQHRMRVVLTHAPVWAIARWALHETVAVQRSFWPRRELKMRAIRWNVRHLPSTLRRRWQLRGSRQVPCRLIDDSWGEGFPVGVPPLSWPDPEAADSAIDMSDPSVVDRLPYGWFAAEEIGGRWFAWSRTQAAALVRLRKPARRVRLEYAQVPTDTGGVEVSIRRAGARDALAPVWTTHLRWQYIERCVENHPVQLPAGDYEVVFSTERAFSDPPSETRQLGFALARMSLEETFDIDPDGLDVGAPEAAGQLISGWLEPEQSPDRAFRWAGPRAAAVVRLTTGAAWMGLTYCLPPAPTAGASVSIRPLNRARVISAIHLPYADSAWRREQFQVSLPKGGLHA